MSSRFAILGLLLLAGVVGCSSTIKDAKDAQGSGTQMARSVSDLVLVSGDFAAVPPMLVEGRKILRNLARVAKLFVTKSAFAVFLIVSVGLTPIAYPLLPRHLTLAASLTIGIPGFFLALAPSSGPVRVHGFLREVLRFAVPAGLIVAAATFSAYALADARGLPLTQQRTAATLVTLTLSLCVLALLAMPLTWRRIALLVAALAGFALLFPVPGLRTFYKLELPYGAIGSTLLIAALGAAALAGFWIHARRLGRGPAEAARE